MVIKSGNLEVLLAGVVFSFGDNSLKFELDEELTIVFKFENDEVDRTFRSSSQNLDANTGQITLINFNSPTGVGNLDAVKLGTIQNRAVYVYYWVSVVYPGALNKKFEYTFFIDRNGH